MRFILVSFVAVCLAFAARGQEVRVESGPFMELIASSHVDLLHEQASIINEPSGILSVQREMYKIPQEPGVRMMKVGKILTGIGAATAITGLLVYNNRDPDYYTTNSYGTTYTDDPHEAGGQLLVGIGVGMIVPGVMVWIHGASKFRKHVEKMEKNAQGLYVPPGKLGLGYRF